MGNKNKRGDTIPPNGSVQKQTDMHDAGQRALIAAYEAIQDLLPEPPKGTWQAWIRLGKRAEKNLSYLKCLWSWKR